MLKAVVTRAAEVAALVGLLPGLGVSAEASFRHGSVQAVQGLHLLHSKANKGPTHPPPGHGGGGRLAIASRTLPVRIPLKVDTDSSPC